LVRAPATNDSWIERSSSIWFSEMDWTDSISEWVSNRITQGRIWSSRDGHSKFKSSKLHWCETKMLQFLMKQNSLIPFASKFRI
jgi:hypothetical protein